jgi:hypothetical protein
LYFSDWRVLPDVVEKFEGERDMWIEWRKRLRQLLPGVDTFESEYNAFKYSFELKYPIDPKQYITKYPNKEVEYLSTEDQFTSYGFRAATDYLTKNVYTIQEYIRNNINNEIIIEQKTRELIQKLRITNYYPDLIEKINANNAEVEELG